MYNSKIYVFISGITIFLSVISYSYRVISQKNLCIKEWTIESGRTLANAKKVCSGNHDAYI